MSSKIIEEEIPKKKYSRDTYIFLSKLYWKAELYQKMISFIKEFISLDPKLEKEERDIIATGFKDMISNKRSSWHILHLMERKEKKKKINTLKEIKIVKNNTEKEIRDICNTLQDLVDKYILPKNDDVENIVFFYKLKADYFRYICEFAEGKEYTDNFNNAEDYYTKAYNLALKNLPILNCNRMAVILNYSIFLYEIKKDKKTAFEIAKKTFFENDKFSDVLEKAKNKDTFFLVQLLRENLLLWNNEIEEEEGKI